MFIWASRKFSNWFVRGALYLGLFALVVMTHGAITSALRTAGWQPGPALVASGAIVLALVVGGVQGLDQWFRMRMRSMESERARLGLPEGPCCVVWQAVKGESNMPWKPVGPVRAPYPPIARRLGVEGFAVVDFEVGADGAAKNLHCIDYWPSKLFYDAAVAALKDARFKPKAGVAPRFGASYRMPFVFRISGAAQVQERLRKAAPHRPGLRTAKNIFGQAVDKLRRWA